MTFSYTQISQYLRCPRSYRFRYLDGWREKESRAALCFGRCFEKALAALFEGGTLEPCCLRSGVCTAMLRWVFHRRRLEAPASPRDRFTGAVRPR